MLTKQIIQETVGKKQKEYEQYYHESKFRMFVSFAQLCELIVLNKFTDELSTKERGQDRVHPSDVRSAAATMPVAWMCRDESSKWVLARIRKMVSIHDANVNPVLNHFLIHEGKK